MLPTGGWSTRVDQLGGQLRPERGEEAHFHCSSSSVKSVGRRRSASVHAVAWTLAARPRGDVTFLTWFEPENRDLPSHRRRRHAIVAPSGIDLLRKRKQPLVLVVVDDFGGLKSVAADLHSACALRL